MGLDITLGGPCGIEITRYFPYETASVSDIIALVEGSEVRGIHRDFSRLAGLMHPDNKETYEIRTGSGLYFYVQFYDGVCRIALHASQRFRHRPPRVIAEQKDLPEIQVWE